MNPFDVDNLNFEKADLYQILDDIGANKQSNWYGTTWLARQMASGVMYAVRTFIKIADITDLKFFFSVFVRGFFDLYYKNVRKTSPLLRDLDKVAT